MPIGLEIVTIIMADLPCLVIDGLVLYFVCRVHAKWQNVFRSDKSYLMCVIIAIE